MRWHIFRAPFDLNLQYDKMINERSGHRMHLALHEVPTRNTIKTAVHFDDPLFESCCTIVVLSFSSQAEVSGFQKVCYKFFYLFGFMSYVWLNCRVFRNLFVTRQAKSDSLRKKLKSYYKTFHLVEA